MLAEDVEDDRGAVDYLDLDDILECAPLARREFGVGDHSVGAKRGDDVAELLGLASSEVGGGIRVRAALEDAIEHDGSGSLGERGELPKGVLGILLLTLGVDADKNDVLEPKLAVLDLSDVFEFGRQARDASERRAFFAIPLIAVGVRSSSRRGILQSLSRPEHPHVGSAAGALKHPVNRVDRVLRWGVLGVWDLVHHHFRGMPGIRHP